MLLLFTSPCPVLGSVIPATGPHSCLSLPARTVADEDIPDTARVQPEVDEEGNPVETPKKGRGKAAGKAKKAKDAEENGEAEEVSFRVYWSHRATVPAVQNSKTEPSCISPAEEAEEEGACEEENEQGEEGGEWSRVGRCSPLKRANIDQHSDAHNVDRCPQEEAEGSEEEEKTTQKKAPAKKRSAKKDPESDDDDEEEVRSPSPENHSLQLLH